MPTFTIEQIAEELQVHPNTVKRWIRQGKPGLCKAVVNSYKAHLLDETNLAPSTINQYLTAIRNLAKEAKDNSLMDTALADGIKNVEGVTSGGRKIGNWLTKKQAREFMSSPDPSTLLGCRNRALLAVAIGAGLRREEIANLTFKHIQMRDERWAVVDILGKRNKYRSVPIAEWIKETIDRWSSTAGITEGYIFRPLTKFGTFRGIQIAPQTVYDTVKKYAQMCGFDLSPHDLRRTFAKLSYKGGTDLKQIQYSLGHSSVETTERYLGIEQDFEDSPSDRLGIKLDIQ